MPHDVFISHSSADKLVASAVCASLESHKIRCWMASRDIIPGTDWSESIINGITESKMLVVVFSSDADKSPQVRREVERAVSKEKIILPFRIEEITPSKAMEFCLSNTHWLDALTPPLEAHLSRLTETVSLLLENKPLEAEMKAVRKVLPQTAENSGRAYEYRCGWELFGLPLVHVAMNLPPVNGRRPGARGFIAIGDSARGVIAIGPFAIGAVAMGGLSMGLFPVGFLAIGVFPIGAVALGLVASWGALSLAPVAAGCVAIGYYTYGVIGIGVLSPAASSPEGIRAWQFLAKPWFNALMTCLCLLSYLLPRAARFWVRSVLEAGTSHHP